MDRGVGKIKTNVERLMLLLLLLLLLRTTGKNNTNATTRGEWVMVVVVVVQYCAILSSDLCQIFKHSRPHS